MSRSASAEGWTLTVAASATPEETLSTISRLRSEGKADGFVIPRTLYDDERIAMLERNYIPYVMFGRTGRATSGASYDIAGEEAMRAAVHHLHRLGHRRIAFVNGGVRYNYSRLREDGYLRGLHDVGLTVDPGIMARDCLSEDDGRDAATRMLALPAPPTGFVYALDRAALGLYAAAGNAGLAVGTHLSVIAYDGIPEGATMSPPLSTYSVDIARAGERLGALLIRHIRGDWTENPFELEEATFLDRGSAAAPVLSSAELADLLRFNNAAQITTNGRNYHEKL